MRFFYSSCFLFFIHFICGCNCYYNDLDEYSFAKVIIARQRAGKLYETRLSYINSCMQDIGSVYSQIGQDVALIGTVHDFYTAINLSQLSIDLNNNGRKEVVVFFLNETTYIPDDEITKSGFINNIGLDCFGFAVFAGDGDFYTPIFYHDFGDSGPLSVKLLDFNNTYRLAYEIDGSNYECGWFVYNKKNNGGIWDGICDNYNNTGIKVNNCFMKFHYRNLDPFPFH